MDADARYELRGLGLISRMHAADRDSCRKDSGCIQHIDMQMQQIEIAAEGVEASGGLKPSRVARHLASRALRASAHFPNAPFLVD